jgi:hypothetical protein
MPCSHPNLPRLAATKHHILEGTGLLAMTSMPAAASPIRRSCRRAKDVPRGPQGVFPYFFVACRSARPRRNPTFAAPVLSDGGGAVDVSMRRKARPKRNTASLQSPSGVPCCSSFAFSPALSRRALSRSAAVAPESWMTATRPRSLRRIDSGFIVFFRLRSLASFARV